MTTDKFSAGTALLYLVSLGLAVTSLFWAPALVGACICLVVWVLLVWPYPEPESTPTPLEGPALTLKTVVPTYQIYQFAQRIEHQDFTAIPEIWPVLFEEPFDETMPMTEVSDALTLAFTAMTETAAVEVVTPDPEPEEEVEYSDAALLLVGAAVILGALIASRNEKSNG